MFTGACHLSQSRARLTQSMLYVVFSKISVHVNLWSVAMSSKQSHSFRFFKQKNYAFLFSLMFATCLAHLILLDVISWIIFCKGFKKLLTGRFSPISSYFCPCKSKYLPHILYSRGSDQGDCCFLCVPSCSLVDVYQHGTAKSGSIGNKLPNCMVLHARRQSF